MTQQDIARMTGVSQATVSLVLNGRDDGSVRIAPETRERVLGAIRATGYVADPVARRLAARHNRILGVFTYEPVFPAGTGDFYHPFLVGIEESAERLGCDLLLLTSAPVTDGRRRIFHDDNRLRLADGCVLLGRSLDRDELGRLVAEGHPFVSVGRRDDAGGPVPYVGADYAAATADVVRRALDAGHTRLAYLGQGAGPESHTDRFAGYRAALDAAGLPTRHETTDRSPADLLDALLDAGVTAVVVEEYADGVALATVAAERGRTVPADLSILALGDPTRPTTSDREFTGFRIPRREMGWQAVEVLTGLLAGVAGTVTQRLLPCQPVDGVTLLPPRH
ncbi:MULTISPECIES: LacI family DNA-binding transcriptional regulator [unclassified Micromonospora]|uniref:LacI family DNA-binding transcriptional regulator n=1 Tax=unclassified Micromonospora TaxID=2617518 RepID=UPI0022B6F70F|nr:MULTISPECIES: LacI family DNA-binding transcriptional regulator [unclassified Micromonospora]MCZ7423341.1 LacI family DNA-binding transcriptional regulator [Verrucosispora sp. WMMA2121]WBB91028.1 LacI family DNA-binding transcriptional regulator [Verrucosispora sp. WMMC514]